MTKALPKAGRYESNHGEVMARQGLRFPPIMLHHLRSAGIYCQPTLSVERQRSGNNYVLRGVESGGGIGDLGAYCSFIDEQGNLLPWLQRVDTVGVNGVHAIVIAPALIRIEVLRVKRTYDVLITRHRLESAAFGRKPRLDSSIAFYGRRGTLEMELWGEDSAFRGTVSPAFFSRSGEAIAVPNQFQEAVARVTAAVCCIACRHCHLLQPKTVSSTLDGGSTIAPDTIASAVLK